MLSISEILGGTMLAYLAAGFCFLLASLWTSHRLRSLATGFMGGGLAAHTLAFLARWLASYHQATSGAPPADFWDWLQVALYQVPLSNFYESLIFFSWCLAFLALVFIRRYPEGFLGVVGGLTAALVLAYASLGADSRIKPLMPALRSNWLLIHVVTCFLGYAAFALAFGAGILYLVQMVRRTPKNPSPALLDRLLYRTAVIGFVFLTLGILTGAVWAETAWGRYWSWDPKETASLLTWLIYAALLHARLVKGWQGRAIAWLAVAGFGAVLFTYFGVSFLLPGLHSYLN
jgi:cytochrome c-type biogenesis protein CcsB|uniref:Heme exporter protein C n=1 Tax=Desulfobacca acetoxidans TaxID=60893 RepID=A0A7C5AKR2_9BACT